MSYFSDNYANFRYPLKLDSDSPGLRVAQLGAIHAAAAHFVTRADPGVITMPTGSGKTAVLISAAYVLRANRVLVVTPSRLVREQIAEELRELGTLRKAGALGEGVEAPRVFSAKKRVTTNEEWEAMREYDVVVGTVQSISPEYATIPEPPADLFDLILVDEAHHSPARTWQAVLSHFDTSKQLLFTATPFRQDQREIKGKFIFTYDLRKAYEDRVFGDIFYTPVTPQFDESHDVAIAKAAERQFSEDRANGYQHHVMVRTDSRKRADELLDVYENNTGLRLKIVTGEKSLKYVKGVIDQLNAGDLDGIVCVNMLGEGFNFPSLKIAAIHSPHRSLSVTLQFIGRFARTAGTRIGPATFLAIPSEIEIEAERLYDARAVWQEMVQNLSATRVNQEAETREVLESFSVSDHISQDLSDLSLYVLEPYFHVKVYQLSSVVDLSRDIKFPSHLQVVYKSDSREHNAVVYITREINLPRWTTDDRLAIVQPDLFIVYQDVASRLLFICASRRSEGLYELLVASFEGSDPRPLPLVRLNRALNDIQSPEFFNVGMRNRVASNTTESYRIITGSNADKAILKSDGRLYHRGHVFGRGTENETEVTIGLSSASKIWSNKSGKLPELIAWCNKLAVRIQSDRVPVTGSGLDFLDVGEEITELPSNIIAADWPLAVYRSQPMVRLPNGGRVPLIDFDLDVDMAASNDRMVVFRLGHESGTVYRATFSFDTERFVEPASSAEPGITIEEDRNFVPLIDYLNDAMPHFYTADLSLVQGYSLLKAPVDGLAPYDDRLIENIDWDSEQVDIRREFGAARPGLVSVHEGLERKLHASVSAIVYYDHGTGEIADFVTVTIEEGGILIQLYHCKGATGDAAGHRLSDVNEITCQAVKSVTWARKQRILSSIRRRYTQNIGSHRFIKGGLDLLEQVLNDATPAQIKYELVAVQPGLKKAGLPAELSNVLAAASDHLVRAGFRPLRVIGGSN